MSKAKKLIADLQKTRNETFDVRSQLAVYVNRVLDSKPGLRMPGDKRTVVDFVIAEFENLQKQLPTLESFREKDELCHYADELFVLLRRFVSSADKLTEPQRAVVGSMGTCVQTTEALSYSIDALFASEPGSDPKNAKAVEASDILRLTDMLSTITDQYHRNMFLTGLLHYADKLPRMTLDAETALQSYVGDEMERLLSIGDDMTEDESAGLELAADLCRYIPCDRLTGIVSRLPSLGRGNINFYALRSLIALKQDVSDELIHQLAFDDEYAAMAKDELDKSGMGDRFPESRRDPKLLYMTSLVHWLTYPTELGKKPDAIKFYCTVDTPDGTTYVYLFKSDSDTLSDDLKNEWLIGWSDDENGSFSQFRPLSSCDQGTPEKTMAYIKSCLQ